MCCRQQLGTNSWLRRTLSFYTCSMVPARRSNCTQCPRSRTLADVPYIFVLGQFCAFDFIGISELYRCINDMRLSLPGYHKLITRCRQNGMRGGVGLSIKDTINYIIREDISVFIPHVFESIFIEIIHKDRKKSIIGIIYRPNTEPHADFSPQMASNLQEIMETANRESKSCIIMGDMNVDLLKFKTHVKTNEYLDNIFSNGFLPIISKPTRICSAAATLIHVDHIYTNNLLSSGYSGIIIPDVADHFGTFYVNFGKHSTNNSTLTKIRTYSQANMT